MRRGALNQSLAEERDKLASGFTFLYVRPNLRKTAGAISLQHMAQAQGTPDGADLRPLRNQARLAQLYRELGRVKDAQGVETQLRKLLAVADPDDPILQELGAPAKGAPMAAAR